MENGLRLQLKFWGVRGSIPTPTPENLGYGEIQRAWRCGHPAAYS